VRERLKGQPTQTPLVAALLSCCFKKSLASACQAGLRPVKVPDGTPFFLTMMPNLRISALSWAGWILLLATVGVMVFVAYEFGQWAFRTAPEGDVRRELHEQILILSFIGRVALVGMAVVIFWIGKTVLGYCGISVFRAQKNSGPDQKS
jgi:hypothetical protein